MRTAGARGGRRSLEEGGKRVTRTRMGASTAGGGGLRADGIGERGLGVEGGTGVELLPPAAAADAAADEAAAALLEAAAPPAAEAALAALPAARPLLWEPAEGAGASTESAWTGPPRAAAGMPDNA